MDYRRLGQTDLMLSLIGFGSSPLGNNPNALDADEGRSAVHLAIDKGINFFDVSPYYGATRAETRLGRALAGRRDQVVLSTKCGRYGEEVFDFSASRITRSIDESLRRLQTDYIDLFLAHDVEFCDRERIIDETMPAMRRLQEQGKARYIGISGYPLHILASIVEAVPLDAVLSYCHYNLMVKDLDDVLTPLAKKRGIGLINAAAFHMGILTEGGAFEGHPAPQTVRDAGQKAVEHCRSRGASITELALRFCIGHSYVSSTLVGMANRREVEANLTLTQGMEDRRELVAEVQKILAPVSNYVWSSGLT